MGRLECGSKNCILIGTGWDRRRQAHQDMLILSPFNTPHTLWKEVGEIAGSEAGKGQGNVCKGRKGFCFGMEKKDVRPGNTSVGKLLSDYRFVEAVVNFLENMGVGKVKKGVVLGNK